MENLVIVIGLILILYAYVRFITDESGNVQLNNYRLTGGIFIVVGGLIEGTIDIFKFNRSRNRFLALLMYIGILAIYLALKI